MTQSIRDLEQDIENTRARLDSTIDRIQDKLTVSGIVDEFMGTARAGKFGAVMDEALAVVKRNPLPVMLVAAGVGWLLHRMSRDQRPPLLDARIVGDEKPRLPVVNIGQARVYDPDEAPVHPGRDAVGRTDPLGTQDPFGNPGAPIR